MAIVERPAVYLMNWSTWCKARLTAKANGAVIEYRRAANGKRQRYVNGVLVVMDGFITTEDIYELTYPDSFQHWPYVGVQTFGRWHSNGRKIVRRQ